MAAACPRGHRQAPAGAEQQVDGRPRPARRALLCPPLRWRRPSPILQQQPAGRAGNLKFKKFNFVFQNKKISKKTNLIYN